MAQGHARLIFLSLIYVANAVSKASAKTGRDFSKGLQAIKNSGKSTCEEALLETSKRCPASKSARVSYVLDWAERILFLSSTMIRFQAMAWRFGSEQTAS